MSSWSTEPGMWVLCQVGLEPGPGAGGWGVCVLWGLSQCPLGPLEASGQPAVWLRLRVNVCAVHVSRQASAQDWDERSSILGLENTSRAPRPISLRVCLKAHQRRPGLIREGKLLSLRVCCVPEPALLVGLGGWSLCSSIEGGPGPRTALQGCFPQGASEAVPPPLTTPSEYWPAGRGCLQADEALPLLTQKVHFCYFFVPLTVPPLGTWPSTHVTP